MIKPPEIKIFSQNLTFIGEALGYTSAIYTRRWQSAGAFEITIPADAFGAGLLKPGNFVMFDNDGHRVGVIEGIDLAEGGDNALSIKGVSLSGQCAWRITEPPTGAANMGYDAVPRVITPGVYPSPVSAETVLKEYARRHMLDNPDKRFPYLEIAPDMERGIRLRWLSRFENLGEVLYRVCEHCDMGYEIYLDAKAKRMVFDIIEGLDRTETSGATPTVFSSKYQSIENVSYSYSLDGYKNLAYVGGSGEAENRLVLLVWPEGAKPVGAARREVFIDAGDLTIAGGLEDEGRRKLSEYPQNESLRATITARPPFIYRKDWDLGDLVTVQSDKAGVTFDTRITEITERYESTEISVIPTFGTPTERLGRKIKRIEQKNTVR